MLASRPCIGCIVFGFNVLNKAYQQLPASHGYKNPDGTVPTSAFHRALDAQEQFFIFLQKDPETIAHFHPFLHTSASAVSWTPFVPLAEYLKDADANTPLFVDIGGAFASECVAFRKATKGVAGRVINQDLSETLAVAPKYDDVEMMAQNFYEGQQVKGSSPPQNKTK